MNRLIVVPAFLLVLAGCSHENHVVVDTDTSDSLATVEVKMLRPAREISLPGELVPWASVVIQAKVKGYVKSVLVDRGSRVRRGQVLAMLEAPELEAQVAEAKSKVEDFRSQSMASRVTYRRLRQTSLTNGAVAANELDLAMARQVADSTQVVAAEAAYEARKQVVNYLTITAPFDGIITSRNVSPGELVGPDGAKSLFSIEDNSTLRLTVAIPELYSAQLDPSAEVSFRVSALPEKKFAAHLSRSSESLDQSIRSMYAEFDVDNHAHLLKSGMYADVQLPVARSASTLFVPASSVVNSTERVFVIRVKDGKLKWTDVRTGVQSNGMVEIFGALREGDPVVARASEELRDGRPVIALASK